MFCKPMGPRVARECARVLCELDLNLIFQNLSSAFLEFSVVGLERFKGRPSSPYWLKPILVKLLCTLSLAPLRRRARLTALASVVPIALVLFALCLCPVGHRIECAEESLGIVFIASGYKRLCRHRGSHRFLPEVVTITHPYLSICYQNHINWTDQTGRS